MSIPVNPPPEVRMPEKLFNDPDLRSYFEKQQKIMFQLWNRTGGGEDLVDSTEQVLTSTGSRVARNAAKINALEKIGFDVEIITADFTTERNQIIICNNTAPITITMDANAIEEDLVHIKRKDGQVTVLGSIDGKTQKVINIKYYSMHLVFDGTAWNEI